MEIEAAEEIKEETKIDLFEYLNILNRNKRFIFAIIIIYMAITTIILLNTVKTYLAEASILILAERQSALLSSLGNFPIPGIGSSSSSTEELMILLNSKTITQEVVTRLKIDDFVEELNKKGFDYTKIFPSLKSKNSGPGIFDMEQKKKDSAINYLKTRTNIKSKKDGLINLNVEWVHPKTGALIVNTYISVLSAFLNDNSINISFKVIDPALPPTSKYKPKILSTLLASLFISFIGSIVFVLIKESFKS